MVTYQNTNDDSIWKAIADGKRRTILDALSQGPKSTGELVDLFPQIGRTAVLKHLDILQNSNLILIKREGRVRWNHINIAPLQAVCSGWILRHVEGITTSIESLKSLAEQDD